MSKVEAFQRALIVDDIESSGRLLARFLHRLGLTTTFVDSGAQALRQLEQGLFDLVLLDLRMPGMSGVDVCRAIRARPMTGRLHVVAYTASALEPARQQIQDAGFDAILIKPISLSAVHLLLKQLRCGRP